MFLKFVVYSSTVKISLSSLLHLIRSALLQYVTAGNINHLRWSFDDNNIMWKGFWIYLRIPVTASILKINTRGKVNTRGLLGSPTTLNTEYFATIINSWIMSRHLKWIQIPCYNILRRSLSELLDKKVLLKIGKIIGKTPAPESQCW